MPPRAGARLRRRIAVPVLALALAVLAGLAVSAVLLAEPSVPRRHGEPTGAADAVGPFGAAPAFASGANPRALVLDGVSGRLEVTPATGPRATADFVPDGDDTPGRVVFGAPGGDGAVPVGCARGDGPSVPCHGVLRLSVPEGTALTVRQTSGEVSLSGVTGDLDLALTSVRFTAVGVRSGRVALDVRSGSADVGFASAPGSLDLDSSSASVALRLPTGGPGEDYAFTSEAVSADVRIALPDRTDADHRVHLHTESASVAVLAAG
ncbi:hypothetical protein [Kitasatospora sp. NBC_00315]|uniref:hypothetical protein n=1 Tax=Kitasatospora sp. NBC_00315 TaxID=2975963 RepID=UPI003243581C